MTSDMLKATGWVLWWSPAYRECATKQLDGYVTCCADALYCFNLSWFSALDFIKKVKYACDRKFTVPKITKIELDLKKLWQKNGAVLFDSHGTYKSKNYRNIDCCHHYTVIIGKTSTYRALQTKLRLFQVLVPSVVLYYAADTCTISLRAM